MEVDGTRVDADGTVLDACRAARAHVDALCYDDRVDAAGHCRACMVEVDGRIVPACTTRSQSDMVVTTASPRLVAYRRDLGELMLAEAAPRGPAGDAVRRWGASGDTYVLRRTTPRETRHPYVRLDPDACIRCRLCARGCDQIQGQFVLAFEGRGRATHLSWAGDGLADAGCTSCGACVALCPAGALSDVQRERSTATQPDRIVRTTCGYCGVGCQLDVHARGDSIQWIDGAQSSVNHEHLCVKGRYAHGFVRHPERLRTPLVRKGDRLVPVSWDEALEFVARGFERLRGRVAALSSARCTNEENYLVQKWFRAALGTHDVDCCARVCHAPTAKGMRFAFGTGAATGSLSGIEVADAFLVAGSNTTEAHPIVGARIRQAILRGAHLVVIDPRRTELAEIADVHLELRPGTNIPLLNSLAHVLVDEDLVDRTFVEARTEGFDALARHLRAFAPEVTERVTRVPAALVRRAARIYAGARSPMQVHGLGMTEHHQGSEAVMLLCNLALLVGAIGRPGVGVNPLRGQNNVQGAADMGCQPDMMTGYADPHDPALRERFEAVWKRPLPTAPGRTLPRMYEAIRSGELRGLFILGEDVVQTDPNADLVRETLRRLELLVVQEIFLSETAALAHVVLPGASFLEKDGTFTNGERRIQRVRRVLDPLEGARPDWKILLELMARTGYPQEFTDPSDVMDEVARVAPGLYGISYSRLEGDGLQWPVPAAHHPGTTELHTASFPTPGGRARLACVDFVPSPSLSDVRGQVLLVTGRVLEHYNSGSMTRRTDGATLHPADELELHPSDALDLRMGDGAPVRVKSESGEAIAVLRITTRVQPGTAFLTFHYPKTGTNRVTTDVLDRLADCPEYKLTAVELSPA